MHLDFEPGQTARLTLLDTGTIASAQLMSITGRRMSVLAEIELRGGTVRLDWPDYIVVADVAGSLPDGTVLLTVRHALRTADIELIRRSWFE